MMRNIREGWREIGDSGKKSEQREEEC